MFYPDTDQELAHIFDRLTRAPHQYLSPTIPPPAANTTDAIVVTVNPATYHVRHRKSYLTGPIRLRFVTPASPRFRLLGISQMQGLHV